MVLKGLPASYKPCVVVITQSEKQMTFGEFKVALRNFEDTDRSPTDDNDESVVMKVANMKHITCFACGQHGHKCD